MTKEQKALLVFLAVAYEPTKDCREARYDCDYHLEDCHECPCAMAFKVLKDEPLEAKTNEKENVQGKIQTVDGGRAPVPKTIGEGS